MDRSRDEDLKELWHEREGKSVAERQEIDKLMHNIRTQAEDEDLSEARADLVGAVRIKDGKIAKKMSERIKVITHTKGLEKNG